MAAALKLESLADVRAEADAILKAVDAEIARLQQAERDFACAEASILERDTQVQIREATAKESERFCEELRASLERKIAVVTARRIAQDAEHEARMTNLGD